MSYCEDLKRRTLEQREEYRKTTAGNLAKYNDQMNIAAWSALSAIFTELERLPNKPGELDTYKLCGYRFRPMKNWNRYSSHCHEFALQPMDNCWPVSTYDLSGISSEAQLGNYLLSRDGHNDEPGFFGRLFK